MDKDFNEPIPGDEDALEASAQPTKGMAKGSGIVKLNRQNDQNPGSHGETIPEKTEAREADSKSESMQTHTKEDDEKTLEASAKPTTGLAQGSGMVKLNRKKDQGPGSHGETIPEKTEAKEADS